jgi:hypothetical protein
MLSLVILLLTLGCSENADKPLNIGSDLGNSTPHHDSIAPIIVAMRDITLETNKSVYAKHHTIVIDVSDNKTSNEDLYVNAFSSNQAVVANNGLTIRFDGKKRLLLVTPMASAVGVTNINLIATDQAGNYAAQNFDLYLKQQIQSSHAFIDNILTSNENTEALLLDNLNISQFEASDNEDIDWYRLAEEHVMTMEVQ